MDEIQGEVAMVSNVQHTCGTSDEKGAIAPKLVSRKPQDHLSYWISLYLRALGARNVIVSRPKGEGRFRREASFM